jgi:MFS family permease
MWAVLSIPAFRNLFIGQALSSIGDSMIYVVVGLYVTDLTGSTTDVGFVLAAYAGPVVVFLLLGGVIADRLPRKAVMIASDGVRAVLHGGAAILIALDAAEIWHLVVIGALFGAAEAFFRPAYTGLVPQTVPEDQIQAAQAAAGVSRELSIVIGPAIGTVLTLGIGAETAFALDALTFVASMFFLARVQPRRRGAQGERSTILRELREGWQAVRERAWVWATIACFSLTLLVALAPYFTLGAAVAKEQYGDAGVFGLAQIVWGLGTVAGTLVAARWRPARPMFAGMLLVVPWPLCFIALSTGAAIPLLVVVTIATGFGVGIFGVIWETALAQRIPPHLLSRVSAYDWMGSLALLPLGYVLGGVLGDHIGPSETLFGGALIAFVALALGLLPRSTRELRRLEQN